MYLEKSKKKKKKFKLKKEKSENSSSEYLEGGSIDHMIKDIICGTPGWLSR